MQPSQQHPTGTKPRRRFSGRVVFGLLALVFGAVFVVSLVQIVRISSTRRAAQDEYTTLAQQAFPASVESGDEGGLHTALAAVMAQNPECVGWLAVPGSAINYPVVQAANNEKYLHRTYLDNENPAGAIFMDYRCNADFTGEHTIIYGHYMQDGTMFAGLATYLNEAYLQANPDILVYTPEGLLRYRVVAARKTDMWDAAYLVDFSGAEDFAAFAETYGAPAGEQGLLTLSTCTGGEKDERTLVHAVFEGMEAY